MANATAVKEEKQVKIGEYLLTGKIGQGGIAEIFRGRQESLSRDVAIKILSPNLLSDADIVRRFERESVVIAQLNHPNIVHVIDRGKAGNRYYFVMEFIDGTSLREVIDSSKIPLDTKLDMLVQVCKALDYAHKNGVIHRDIKPTNILIDKQGNARVADFGIAQILGLNESEMTSGDVIMGTVAYMSPEQKVSSTNVDQTTDIYAIGIMLYEMLTGKKPQGHFRLPSEFDQSLRGFDDIILKTLAQEPRDRYQSAVELKDAILNQISGGNRQSTTDYSLVGAESFMGKCRYLDTIKETKFSSTILVENRANKRLYIIKKHSKGEVGRKEAKLLSSLRHEHINPIYGSGGDSRSTVVISEYAQGGSLADRMVRKYEWYDAMKLAVQVAEGLGFAHKNNVVHGNLRPSNLLFDANDKVKIADFGLPSHYDGKKNWYAPPEFKPSKIGDIYALGVILHQLLLNRTPEYDHTDKLKIDELYMQVPQDVEAMLTKMLAIRVVNRYRSCEEFLADWKSFDDQYQESQRRPVVVPVAEPEQKNALPPWVWYAAGAAVVITIIAVVLAKIL
ncbi:MAG: protein kinase [bacterium]|nr:protein kinase [bacterium]